MFFNHSTLSHAKCWINQRISVGVNPKWFPFTNMFISNFNQCSITNFSRFLYVLGAPFGWCCSTCIIKTFTIICIIFMINHIFFSHFNLCTNKHIKVRSKTHYWVNSSSSGSRTSVFILKMKKKCCTVYLYYKVNDNYCKSLQLHGKYICIYMAVLTTPFHWNSLVYSSSKLHLTFSRQQIHSRNYFII